jgi:CHAT domain-containing protein
MLSACETGLGATPSGEGTLGLQRAFQVAGARTVLASLWPVADDSARELAERFYENLWKRKLGKLESLRQAQLAIIHGQKNRGVSIVPLQPDSAAPPAPPYYWAAFVLSGDWR